MGEPVVVHSTWDHEETEKIVAAALTLTAPDFELLDGGAPVLKRVSDCLSLKYVFALEADGTVIVSKKRERKA